MNPATMRQRLREGAPTVVAHHKGRRRIVGAVIAIGDARIHGRAFVIRLCGYLPEVRRETIALGVVADA